MFGSSNLYNPSYSGTNKGTLYTGNSGMSSTPGIIKKSYMELQPQLNINGKDEKVYVSNEGIYYYKDGDKYIALSDKDAKSIKDAGNKAVVIRNDIQNTKTNNTNASSGGSNASGSGSGGGGFRGTETTTTKQETTGSGVDLTPLTKTINDLAKQLAEQDAANKKFMEEYFKRPERLGAEYWADILGVDYNYDNILKDYNQKTNDYYDSLIAENEDLRNRYNRNNYSYLNNLINSYLNSYKQAAPTATNNKAKAATALANTLYGADYNRDNDYTALQNSNYLEQERQAELAMNPYTAAQQYNDLGTYLGNLEGTIDVEKYKQYINALDAYSQKYSANRAASSILYNANAAKYKGLADAAGTAATGAANNYNNSNKINELTNYYIALANGNKTLGSTAAWNTIKKGGGILPSTTTQ